MNPTNFPMARAVVVSALLIGLSTPGFSRASLQRDSRHAIDSNLSTSLPYHAFDFKFMRDRHQRSAGSYRKALFPDSQLYVVDTAIVRTTQDTTRHLYSFNGSGKVTLDLGQRLEAGLWVDTIRITYTYDASNDMLSEEYVYLSNGLWVGEYRSTYTYDASGNMLTETDEEWSNGQWVNSARFTYTYDSNGNVLTDLNELWTNGQWANNWLANYAYDVKGNMLTELDEQWSNGQWVNSSLTTDTCDANGKLLIEVNQQWSNTQWANYSRQTYTYDTNEKALTELIEYWSSSQWTNSWLYTYTYDASGNMITELHEQWSYGQWVNFARYFYAYDTNRRLVDEVYQQYLMQWINNWRTTYNYDANGNMISFWYDIWVGFSWVPTNGSCSWNDSAGNMYAYNGCNITLIYGTILTGVTSNRGIVPAGTSLSQNYPNPFNPSTTIRYELPHASNITLTVYNALGQQVATLVNESKPAGVYTVQFDAKGLASGVYFYRLTAGSSVETKKLSLVR